MGTETLKSAAITALDATPPVLSGSGRGGAGVLRSISATILPTDAKDAGSLYKFVRIPSNAIVKHIFMQSAAWTEGGFDLGLYYSDSTTDGTPASLQGTAVGTDLADFFMADSIGPVFDSILAMTDVAFLNPSEGYLTSDANGPIWAAANLGLTADPGGYFDIVGTLVGTSSVPLTVFLECQFII